MGRTWDGEDVGSVRQAAVLKMSSDCSYPDVIFSVIFAGSS